MKMNKSILLAICAAAIASGLAAESAVAQPYQGQPYQNQGRNAAGQPQYGAQTNPYDEAYRAGYRAGYQAARQRARYDDQPGPANYYGNADPNQRWRQRYGQTYSYNDDR